jgi:hypothetical protein
MMILGAAAAAKRRERERERQQQHSKMGQNGSSTFIFYALLCIVSCHTFKFENRSSPRFFSVLREKDDEEETSPSCAIII